MKAKASQEPCLHTPPHWITHILVTGHWCWDYHTLQRTFTGKRM